MLARPALAVFLLASLQACVAYEYEHEFWIRVDGSGSLFVTGRPELFVAFKGVGRAEDPEATRDALRALFESSGLRVRRATLTRRDGLPYVFLAADFADVNRLAGSPAFPDLRIGLRPEADRLVLEGAWRAAGPPAKVGDRAGLVAVRFHLPSKVYSHKNAAFGVERGNIVAWRQAVAQAQQGGVLEFGAILDRRSILGSTLGLFAAASVVAGAILGGSLFFVFRRGKRAAAGP